MARTINVAPEDIVEAARRVIQEKGLEAATLRAVAREAGVTLGTVYYHFNTKEALLNEIIRTILSQQLKEYSAAFCSAASREERISLTLQVVRDKFAKDQDFHRLFYSLVARGLSSKTAAEEMRYILDTIRETIEKMLSEENLENFPEIPVEHLSRILRSVFDGLALQLLFDQNLDIDAVYDSLEKILKTLIK